MQPSPNLRKASSKLADCLVLLIVGAWLMLQYLDWQQLVVHDRVWALDQMMAWLFMVTQWLANALRVKTAIAQADPSPRLNGTAVVVLIGLAVTYSVHRAMPAGRVLIGDGMALIATALVAVIVWRFATRNADAIGEARFTGKR